MRYLRVNFEVIESRDFILMYFINLGVLSYIVWDILGWKGVFK